MAKSKASPGFKKVQSKIAARMGVPMKAAGAILASKTRKAVAGGSAKRNPKLLKVKGKAKTSY